MSTKVYAHGMQIARQAGDGEVTAAFPDMCTPVLQTRRTSSPASTIWRQSPSVVSQTIQTICSRSRRFARPVKRLTVHDRTVVKGADVLFDVPTIFSPRARGYFNPTFWSHKNVEDESRAEWPVLRERFALARKGNAGALADLLDIYVGLSEPDTRKFARNLLGDAGPDSLLSRTEKYVVDEAREGTTPCELCHSLGLWGRLSSIDAIFTVYERWYPYDDATGLPAYLTTMLEAEFGPAADYPREDTVEAMETYEAGLRALQAQRLAELGGPTAYAFFGERFSVRKVAERMLSMLGRSRYEKMMRPYLRQRFEASTGIDCSDFYQDGEFRPLTTAAKLEAWLASDAPDAFEEGERYFFGHRIPRGT